MLWCWLPPCGRSRCMVAAPRSLRVRRSTKPTRRRTRSCWGAGRAKLAEAVVSACKQPSNFEFLYPLDWPIKKKIETIATKIYGADRVSYEPLAEQQIANYERAGVGKLPR